MRAFPEEYFDVILFKKVGLSQYDFSDSATFTDKSYWKQLFYIFDYGVFWRVQ